jgi:hypothetical protein
MLSNERCGGVGEGRIQWGKICIMYTLFKLRIQDWHQTPREPALAGWLREIFMAIMPRWRRIRHMVCRRKAKVASARMPASHKTLRYRSLLFVTSIALKTSTTSGNQLAVVLYI